MLNISEQKPLKANLVNGPQWFICLLWQTGYDTKRLPLGRHRISEHEKWNYWYNGESVKEKEVALVQP